MIKQASVSAINGDSSSYPQGQAEYNGKATNFTRLTPWGLDSNPSEGAFVLLLSSQGQEAVKLGMSAAMTKRFKGLGAGEIAVYNPDSESFIHFKSDGSIDVLANKDLILNVTGNITETIGGNVTQTITGNLASTIGGTLDFTVTGNTTVTTPLFKVVGNAEITNNLLVGNTTTTNSIIIGGVPSPGISQVNGNLIVKAQGAQAGDITADGTITALTEVTVGTINLSTHLHTNVQTGTSNTGGPI